MNAKEKLTARYDSLVPADWWRKRKGHMPRGRILSNEQAQEYAKMYEWFTERHDFHNHEVAWLSGAYHPEYARKAYLKIIDGSQGVSGYAMDNLRVAYQQAQRLCRENLTGKELRRRLVNMWAPNGADTTHLGVAQEQEPMLSIPSRNGEVEVGQRVGFASLDVLAQISGKYEKAWSLIFDAMLVLDSIEELIPDGFSYTRGESMRGAVAKVLEDHPL